MGHAICVWTDNYINSSFHEIFLHLLNIKFIGVNSLVDLVIVSS